MTARSRLIDCDRCGTTVPEGDSIYIEVHRARQDLAGFERSLDCRKAHVCGNCWDSVVGPFLSNAMRTSKGDG